VAEQEENLTREETVERISNALWKTSEEKLRIIAAILDL